MSKMNCDYYLKWVYWIDCLFLCHIRIHFRGYFLVFVCFFFEIFFLVLVLFLNICMRLNSRNKGTINLTNIILLSLLYALFSNYVFFIFFFCLVFVLFCFFVTLCSSLLDKTENKVNGTEISIKISLTSFVPLCIYIYVSFLNFIYFLLHNLLTK